ncbi:MAG: phage protease [Thermoanaerobaculia bacterium]
MDGFSTVLDAPTQLAEPTDKGPVVSEHPIARLGRFRDPRYGKFAIDRRQFESWQRNLAETQNGRLAIDYDHHAERQGGSTKAAGWITELRLDGDKVMARIEWTPEGAEAVRARYYLFVSPSFVSDYRDESGASKGPALLGVALTNRPFLQKGMPALSLSRESLGFAESDPEPPPAPGGSGDSPPRMPDLAKIAEALSLDKEADEAAILAAVSELSREPEPVALSKQAEAEGKVVLDKDALDQLRSDAKAGAEAKEELFNQRFELAYDKALSEVRVDAKDETKADWHALYEAAPDVTLARLDALPSLANTEGRGSGDRTNTEPEFEGEPADEERVELDRRARDYMTEHELEDTTDNYVLAIEKVS